MRTLFTTLAFAFLALAAATASLDGPSNLSLIFLLLSVMFVVGARAVGR